LSLLVCELIWVFKKSQTQKIDCLLSSRREEKSIKFGNFYPFQKGNKKKHWKNKSYMSLESFFSFLFHFIKLIWNHSSLLLQHKLGSIKSRGKKKEGEMKRIKESRARAVLFFIHCFPSRKIPRAPLRMTMKSKKREREREREKERNKKQFLLFRLVSQPAQIRDSRWSQARSFELSLSRFFLLSFNIIYLV
jgi:hypothetical protein